MTTLRRECMMIGLLLVAIGIARGDVPPPPDPPPRASESPPQQKLGPTLHVGSKAFTESVILGEVLRQLAIAKGSSAEHIRELGGTTICWEGLITGKLDAYPEYTGTLLLQVFEKDKPRDDAELRALLAKNGVAMTGRLGFNNSYALGMREVEADRLGIKTISDLAKHPEIANLRFGLSDEFLQRNDAWPGLRSKYGLPTTRVRAIDHALAFTAMESGGIDVMDIWTTDAEIAAYKLKALEDDKGYFPLYDAVVLYRLDLKDRAPQVAAAIEGLAGRIDAPTMIRLNANARVTRLPESQVASGFLRDKLGVQGEETEPAWKESLRSFLQHTGEHLFLVVISLGMAIVVAVPLGVVAYRYPSFGQGVLAVVGIIQTIPAMAMLVFVIPFLGLGAWPAIVALFLYSLLPIVRGTHTGLTEIAPQVHESAEVLGLPNSARLWLVELPLASPSILAGIKTAAVINVGTATIGALIGAGGYGQPILSGIRLKDISLILQGAVPAALLAIVVQFGFELSERWLVPAGLRVAKE